MGRGCGEGCKRAAWTRGTQAGSLQVSFPLSECFLVFIILSLSQGQNCLFSTRGNPIRENWAGHFDHHSPGFSEGPCFGYRSELKRCTGIGRKGESLSPHDPETSWETPVLEGTPEEELGTCVSLYSYEFKFMNEERTNKQMSSDQQRSRMIRS